MKFVFYFFITKILIENPGIQFLILIFVLLFC